MDRSLIILPLLIIIVVIAQLMPAMIRLARAAIRLAFARLRTRVPPRSYHVPSPLPLGVDASMLKGRRVKDIDRVLGRPSDKLPVKDCVAMCWDHLDPRVVAFVRDGVCLDAILDLHWHKLARTESELRQRVAEVSSASLSTLDGIESVLGTCDSVSSMDFGRDVAMWQCGRLQVEAWFDNGRLMSLKAIEPHDSK